MAAFPVRLIREAMICCLTEVTVSGVLSNLAISLTNPTEMGISQLTCKKLLGR